GVQTCALPISAVAAARATSVTLRGPLASRIQRPAAGEEDAAGIDAPGLGDGVDDERAQPLRSPQRRIADHERLARAVRAQVDGCEVGGCRVDAYAPRRPAQPLR